MDPKNESFWSSKTMQLLFLAFALITVLVIMAIVAKVIWGIDVFAVIGSAIAAVTALAGGGTARNAMVDGPVRQQYAALDISRQVSNDPSLPNTLIPQILSGSSPQVWTPPSGQSDDSGTQNIEINKT